MDVMIDNNGNVIAPDTPRIQQVCRINIAFPVKSDAEALAVKTRVQEATKNIPEAQIMFTIVSAPSMPPVR